MRGEYLGGEKYCYLKGLYKWGRDSAFRENKIQISQAKREEKGKGTT